MKVANIAGWLWAAVGLTAVAVIGGWIAADAVDTSAKNHWRELAEEEAADVTESIAVALEQTEQRLFAFARSLPDSAQPYGVSFNLAFTSEAKALKLTETSPSFKSLAYAIWIPADARSAFEDGSGIHILTQDGERKRNNSEALVVVSTMGNGPFFVGLDLLSDPQVAITASNGFRAGGTVVTGPSFEQIDQRLTPVAVRQGSGGLMIGLVDIQEALGTVLAIGMPPGMAVSVEERAAGSIRPGYTPIFDYGTPGDPILFWETRYAQGGVGWRFHWSANQTFRGGPDTYLGDAIRIGSVVSSLLIGAVLAFASAARRREFALDRERWLMQTTAQQMAEGISIVDQDFRFVACNDHFRRMYDLPENKIPFGTPMRDLIWYRARRGDIGMLEDIDAYVDKRMQVLRQVRSEITQEKLADGRAVEIRRSRTPDGFLVSLYLDVTDRHRAEAEKEAASALVRTTFDHMTDGLAAVDSKGRLLHWNARLLEIFNLDDSMVTAGQRLQLVLTQALEAMDSRTLSTELDRMLAEGRATAQDGLEIAPRQVHLSSDLWLQLSHRPIPERGFVITFTDVSEQMRMNEALRKSEERYALAAEGAHDGLWDWDMTASRLYTSSRWREMLGLSKELISERVDEWFDRVHPKDFESLQQNIQDHLDGRTDHMQSEFRLLHSDGDYFWALARGVASRSKGGVPVRLTGSLTDISLRKQTEEKLIRDALYDLVTGLPNRALFLDRIEQERRRHQGEKQDHFAVLFLDLDRFKVINDSLGHDLGDALLIKVARRLQESLKSGDSLARLSGDEFGILLTGIESADAALDAVHWLQADMAAAFTIGNQEIFTSVCVGISLPSQGFSDAEEMLRAADIAMYKAKERGQSSTAVFDPQMQSRAITQMQLENDLRRAVDRGEIEMFYQPIICFTSGRIAGVEALARWRHPHRGTVVPADFIPLAEDTGLISAIGTTALQLACRQMKAWKTELGDLAPDTISVNLSGRQLQDPDMAREIELLLAREGVDGAQLKLEVTESMIMMNPEVTSRILVELKELGVALSIDDFGTGYSSLSYLHRFPFDTLKIDRSFVVSMEEKSENMEIIRSIALLAHNLGMDIVAEGVETDRHLRHLRQLRCEYGQGFYFSPPVQAEAISRMVQEQRDWRATGT